jgi:PPIC-type PPIASE domain
MGVGAGQGRRHLRQDLDRAARSGRDLLSDVMRALVAAVALPVIAGVVGCAGSPRLVAVRVGDVSIGARVISHWARIIDLDGEVDGSLVVSHGTSRERALAFVISACWLTGEAVDQGIAISGATIERRLQERIESVPNGKSEFEREISSTGRSIADVKLEIEAESAAARLRAMVARRVHPVTQASVDDYYRHNQAHFRVPEIRVTDLIEGIHGTRAAAVALGRRIGPGRRFAELSLHERVARPIPSEASHRENGALVRSIFTAVPGEVAGPTRFNDAWVLVVVRSVVPAGIRPLAAVREDVAARLASRRHRRVLLAFIKAYRGKWIRKTDCSPGFVVQKCSLYHGPTAPEGNPLSGH